MQILINHQQSVLKKGTSFEYVLENRLFSGADGYTLSILFPLKDCWQNQRIFGKIGRMDISVRQTTYDCIILDSSIYLKGLLTIVDVTDEEVKCQFLEGRSQQNYSRKLSEIYINELSLGYPDKLSFNDISPILAWCDNGNMVDEVRYVALPWVDGEGRMQNLAAQDTDNQWTWNEDSWGLSYQPYLIYIAKKICEAVGYSYDFSLWEQNPSLRYLLICNCLPYSYGIRNFARALPHWSVEEFFSQLELLMAAEFEIDLEKKTIRYNTMRDAVNMAESENLSKVLDSYQTEIPSDDNGCGYLQSSNLAYKDGDHPMQNYYSCAWLISELFKSTGVVEVPNMNGLLEVTTPFASFNGNFAQGGEYNFIYHVSDTDRYFVLRAVSRIENGPLVNSHQQYDYRCILQQLDAFGPRIKDPSSESFTEIGIIPVCIDWTDEDKGLCMFLTPGNVNEQGLPNTGEIDSYDDYLSSNTAPIRLLNLGKKENLAEYYSSIYVGWWNGSLSSDGKLPHPIVSDVEVKTDFSGYSETPVRLRLNSSQEDRFKVSPNINPKQKTVFKFLSNRIPNVRALFHINGKRYICEKITATFRDDGMSQLMKGVFYEIVE